MRRASRSDIDERRRPYARRVADGHDQLGDEGRNTERGQVCPRGSSQIMEPPVCQSRRHQLGGPCVNGGFEPTEALDRSTAAVSRKHELPANRGNDLSRSTAMPESGTSCRLPLLVRLGRDHPKRIVEVNLSPTSYGQLHCGELQSGAGDGQTAPRDRCSQSPFGYCPWSPARPEQSRSPSGPAVAGPFSPTKSLGVDEMAGAALDELTRDAKPVDAGCQCQCLGCHVRAGPPHRWPQAWQ